MDIRNFLAELVAYPTVDAEGAMQLLLRDRLAELGFATELQDALPGRPNLIASRGHGGPLLNTHVDVFPAYDHPSPFALRQEGDLLVARGALDTKGQIAALFAALEMSSRPCQVALTVDEERQGTGAERLALEAEGAVVLEPTALALAVAEAGFIEIEVVVPGRPAHGAMPERGDNAVFKALRLYEELTGLPFMKARHPFFPPPWANLGVVEGGPEPNVVPFRCRFVADLSILPGVSLRGAMQQVRQTVERAGAAVTELDSDAGFEIPLQARVVRTVARAVEEVGGRRVHFTGMRSWTDAANFFAKGIPSVVIGAGDLAVAHSDRETVSLTELEFLSRVLARVIEGW